MQQAAVPRWLTSLFRHIRGHVPPDENSPTPESTPEEENRPPPDENPPTPESTPEEENRPPPDGVDLTVRDMLHVPDSACTVCCAVPPDPERKPGQKWHQAYTAYVRKHGYYEEAVKYFITAGNDRCRIEMTRDVRLPMQYLFFIEKYEGSSIKVRNAASGAIVRRRRIHLRTADTEE